MATHQKTPAGNKHLNEPGFCIQHWIWPASKEFGDTIMLERHNNSQFNHETKLNNWGQ